MPNPVCKDVRLDGSVFEVRIWSLSAPEVRLVRNKTRDERSIPKSRSIGFLHVYEVDFYGQQLFDITGGTWRLYARKDGRNAKFAVRNPFDREYELRGYTYQVRGMEDASVSFKVTRTYAEGEETHELRIANAEAAYGEFRKLPVQPNKVFFESTSKHAFNDNPKAIYEALRDSDLGYELVWGLANEKTPIGQGGTAVRYFTRDYWYHLATAKYIVCNYNQYRYIKRPEQVYIQTMHGTPLKKMGLSVTKSAERRARMKVMFESDWDYFVSPSDFFSGILRGPSYGFTGQILECGYPRNDYLVNNRCNEVLRQKVRASLGVPEGKRMILYAPTWRTKKRFDLKLDLPAMKAALGQDYVCVLRAHYLEQQFVPSDVYDDFVIDGHGYANVNEMLVACDVLVTDYSSVMFDFAILGRPLLVYAWDYDAYVGKSRGTYVDLKAEYPQLVAETSDELVHKFGELDSVMEAVRALQERFNQYESGRAAQDVVDRIFRSGWL